MKTLLPLLAQGLRCLFMFVALPFAPVSEDRIIAARWHRSGLSRTELLRQQRSRWSLLWRLSRAAQRQQRMNALNQPAWDELQARQWERWFCYMRFFQHLVVCATISYGAVSFAYWLQGFSPGAYAALTGAGRILLHWGKQLAAAITHWVDHR